MKCCVWNSQRVCCLPGGSLCRNSADIQNYCPGPNEGMTEPTVVYGTVSLPYGMVLSPRKRRISALV